MDKQETLERLAIIAKEAYDKKDGVELLALALMKNAVNSWGKEERKKYTYSKIKNLSLKELCYARHDVSDLFRSDTNRYYGITNFRKARRKLKKINRKIKKINKKVKNAEK